MVELTSENITHNLEDALDGLQKLNQRISSGKITDEIEFQIAMQHIYHHLNFAWNTRYDPIENHIDLTQEQFVKRGRFPEDLELICTKNKPLLPPSKTQAEAVRTWKS